MTQQTEDDRWIAHAIARRRLVDLRLMIDRREAALADLYAERTLLFVALRDKFGLKFREIAKYAGVTEAAVIQKYQKATGTRPEDRRNGHA